MKYLIFRDTICQTLAVLGIELKASHLLPLWPLHQPFFVLNIFNTKIIKLFPQAGFEP
jgi:hypothetical protein